jgi:hypothetical protein
MEALSGYECEHFDSFCQVLTSHNTDPKVSTFVLGIDDLMLHTDLLPSVVASGAKSNEMALDTLTRNLRLPVDDDEKTKEMKNQIDTCNLVDVSVRLAGGSLYLCMRRTIW